MSARIRPLGPDDHQAILSLALEAWEPIFKSFAAEHGRSIY